MAMVHSHRITNKIFLTTNKNSIVDYSFTLVSMVLLAIINAILVYSEDGINGGFTIATNSSKGHGGMMVDGGQ